MKTEEKTLSVKITILGTVNVGKSALTVRYLTRRFIGEYRSDNDLLYRQTVTVNNLPLEIEIIDVSGETRDKSLPTEQLDWSDACIICYSITDRRSFEFALKILENLKNFRSVPHIILGNKIDLEHLRQVNLEEVRQAAIHYGCPFYEVSVAENSPELYQAFDYLINECRRQQSQNGDGAKPRKFSVTKMFGTLIGDKKGRPLSPTRGTVVVCSNKDLNKNCVLKQRQSVTTFL